ncbi:hypothetical protein SLA2020_038760 [Shorea laevis]
MVGGGSRRDEPLVISSTNVFAALGTLRKKKKAADKDQGSSSKGKAKKTEKNVDKKEVFWAPAPLTAKSWADVDDDDDDDYYATTAPMGSAWGAQKESQPALEDSDSEVEGLDDVEEDVEEEHENEPEDPVQEEPEPVVKKPSELSVQKDTERQLSKKELKKKGLEELDAVLAELGYPTKETVGSDESCGVVKEKKAENEGMEKKENAPAESKTAKKKKKKDKVSKEVKESSQCQPEGTDVAIATNEISEAEKPEEAPDVDVKERLKKVASAKKKKSNKEMDAAARAAAGEAAARNARLAAAKKKEKNHYNQQPVR